MKLAIVTDDHQTISAHFGRAQYYEVFTIEAGKLTARTTHVKTNIHLASPAGQPEQVESHHHHDHNAMLAPILDCQVLLAGGMGMGAHLSLKEHGIQPVITDIREIEAALQAYIAGSLVDHPERLH